MSTAPRVSAPLVDSRGERRWGSGAVIEAYQPPLTPALERLTATLDAGIVGHALKELVRIRNARVTDCER